MTHNFTLYGRGILLPLHPPFCSMYLCIAVPSLLHKGVGPANLSGRTQDIQKTKLVKKTLGPNIFTQ